MINEVIERDLNDFVHRCEFHDVLKHSRFLITGATGLLGSCLVRCLYALNCNVHMTLPVRNKQKALSLFNGFNQNVQIIECDLLFFLNSLDASYDYIIHCASPTNGAFMTRYPVETYNFVCQSTSLLLNYAQKNEIKGMVYVSSVEYYGQIDSDINVTENVQGFLDLSNPRNCYPMSKRAAEFLCVASAKEFDIPVKVARLTQTFGAGVPFDDKRVFAQFARSVILNEDIILHTDGLSAKPYCYLIDAVDALLFILLKGASGDAYNVANDSSYITIADLAKFLQKEFNPDIKVRKDIRPDMGYAPITKLKISSKKLRALGWEAKYELHTMFDHLIASMKIDHSNLFVDNFN